MEEIIKYKLKDDPEKVEELLDMIDEEIEVTRRGIRIWYEEEINQLKSETEQKLNNQKIEYEQKIAQKDQIISEKDQALLQKDYEINRLRAMMEERAYSK